MGRFSRTLKSFRVKKVAYKNKVCKRYAEDIWGSHMIKGRLIRLYKNINPSYKRVEREERKKKWLYAPIIMYPSEKDFKTEMLKKEDEKRYKQLKKNILKDGGNLKEVDFDWSYKKYNPEYGRKREGTYIEDGEQVKTLRQFVRLRYYGVRKKKKVKNIRLKKYLMLKSILLNKYSEMNLKSLKSVFFKRWDNVLNIFNIKTDIEKLGFMLLMLKKHLVNSEIDELLVLYKKLYGGYKDNSINLVSIYKKKLLKENNKVLKDFVSIKKDIYLNVIKDKNLQRYYRYKKNVYKSIKGATYFVNNKRHSFYLLDKSHNLAEKFKDLSVYKNYISRDWNTYKVKSKFNRNRKRLLILQNYKRNLDYKLRSNIGTKREFFGESWLDLRQISSVLYNVFKNLSKRGMTYQMYVNLRLDKQVEYFDYRSRMLLQDNNVYSSVVFKKIKLGECKLMYKYLLYYYIHYSIDINKYLYRIWWYYRLFIRHKVYNKMVRLIHWNVSPTWEKYTKREYSKYLEKFSRRRKKYVYFQRDRVRWYYGRLKKYEYKRLLKQLRKKKYMLKYDNYNEGFIGLFENRLCTILYKLHYFNTIFSSKEAIKNGLAKVNNVVIYYSNYTVYTGSIVSLNKDIRIKVLKDIYKKVVNLMLIGGVPGHLEVNYNNLSCLVWRNPTRDDLYTPSGIKLGILGGDGLSLR